MQEREVVKEEIRSLATMATAVATLMVGEVSEKRRPASWGWKLHLFYCGEVHSHATVVSCRLFKSDGEASVNAEKVAEELGVVIDHSHTAVCAGSDWMKPEAVG